MIYQQTTESGAGAGVRGRSTTSFNGLAAPVSCPLSPAPASFFSNLRNLRTVLDFSKESAMSLLACKVFATIVLLAAGLLSVVAAQSPASTPDWETLRPESEEFTVLMPKGSTFESSKEPYHKMELNSRVYLSSAQAGPVFAVVSLSGIKSNPALYSEMQRVNSYVDAFKNLFPPKVRPKTAPVKLTLVSEKTLQGHAGREYSMTVGDLSGVVQAFATRKRFYALVYLNSKKQDSIQTEFVSS